MLFTGMRRSELVALKYENIDFKQKRIKVESKVIFIGNNPKIIYELKNGDSYRYITIPTYLIKKFIKYNFHKKNGFIFVNKSNKLMTKYENQKMWEEYCKNINLVCQQHQLRHTYTSILYKSGVDIKTAQELLGHKDVQTTLNIYTHLDKEYKAKSIDKLNQYINEYFK